MNIDFKDIRWIQNNSLPPGKANDYSLIVGQVIPPIYNSYCRILHPFITNNKQVSWKTFANKYGVYYYDNIALSSFTNMFNKTKIVDDIIFPNDFPDNQTLEKCLNVINAVFPETKISVYSKLNDTLFSCLPYEVLTNFDDNFMGYIYLDDKLMLQADTDQQYTLVGGPEELINKLKETNLEIIDCSSSTRIDSQSDKVNRQRI